MNLETLALDDATKTHARKFTRSLPLADRPVLRRIPFGSSTVVELIRDRVVVGEVELRKNEILKGGIISDDGLAYLLTSSLEPRHGPYTVMSYRVFSINPSGGEFKLVVPSVRAHTESTDDGLYVLANIAHDVDTATPYLVERSPRPILGSEGHFARHESAVKLHGLSGVPGYESITFGNTIVDVELFNGAPDFLEVGSLLVLTVLENDARRFIDSDSSVFSKVYRSTDAELTEQIARALYSQHCCTEEGNCCIGITDFPSAQPEFFPRYKLMMTAAGSVVGARRLEPSASCTY